MPMCMGIGTDGWVGGWVGGWVVCRLSKQAGRWIGRWVGGWVGDSYPPLMWQSPGPAVGVS